MEATIQEVTRITGVTSRTLRHYDAIGLLAPSGTGPGGIRRYDDAALGRLQRILALRDLGLPLAEVRAVLTTETDEAVPVWTALEDIPWHRMWEDDRHWLPLLIDETPFHGRFVFEGETMRWMDMRTGVRW